MVSHSRGLTFRLITEQSALFSIVEDWRRLLAQSADPEPMMDPSWQLCWWRQYGAGVELAVGLLFDEDHLVGLAPLCITRFSYYPGLAFRRLQFMTVDAAEKDGVCSMYMNFIAASGYETLVAQEFADCIAAGQFGTVHEVMLGPARNASPTPSLVQRRLEQNGLRCEQQQPSTNFYVRLPSTWDEFLNSMSLPRRAHIRSVLAQFQTWAAENGGWRLEHATTPDLVEKGFATLIGLQQERSSPRFVAFQRNYISARSASDAIEIASLIVGVTPVAAIYTIRNGKKVLAYNYGGASGIPNQMNVGMVINALMIQKAIASGDEAFDFLSGSSGFEAAFATDERSIISLRAVRPCWREVVRLGVISTSDAARVAASLGISLLSKSPLGTIWAPAQR
jgi:CelD/BcsL family acetyltransferase involved in cellulose biosynthesis